MTTIAEHLGYDAGFAGSQQLRAYEMDDEPTIYAAESAEIASVLYAADSGFDVEDEYPRELTDAELDLERPFYDENERETGETTTIRRMLAEAMNPGYLCGAMR